MNVEKVLATPYVRELLCLLTSWIAENPNKHLKYWSFEEILDHTNIRYQYNWGSSRIAISHEKWDFVIKIDHDEWGDVNASAREVFAYQEAKRYGVQEALLPIAEWFDIGLPNGCLYIQQKADYQWSTMPVELDRKILKIYQYSEDVPWDIDFNRTNSRYICYLIRCYGEEFVRRMVKWAEKCRVNDLHGSNCGFVDEMPKLLDYAGFWE